MSSPAPAPLPADRHSHAATALFLAALIPGVYEFLHPANFGFGRGNEMAAIARNLASHGAFANPFEPFLTGPTASNPPLYPLFLAALLRLFGPAGVVVATVLLHIVLNAAVAALLPRLSRVCFGRAAPGVAAAVLWILGMRLMPQWDTTVTAAALVVFCLWTASSRNALAAGLFGGAISLLNPGAVLIFLPWVVYLVATRRRPCRYLATIAALVCLSNVPWVVRNYRIWHTPVLRSNFGYTVYTSNNDCAQSSHYRNALTGCYQRTHPSASASEAALLASMGEVRYDRLRATDTFRWIGEHRRRFTELTAARVAEFWFPDPGPAPGAAYAMWLATALSLPGMILLFLRRETVAWYIVAAWLLYPPMFYIVVSADRYRFPLLWTSLLPAGYAVEHLLRRYVSRERAE